MAHKYTEDQKSFIREKVKGLSTIDLTELFNEKFGTSLRTGQIRAFKKNNKIKSGLSGCFKKGNVPYNKGKKGLMKGNVTSFKKGNTPKNYKPIGSERVDRDGYVLVKVQDGGTWPERWRHKGKVMWEKYHNRKVPKGYTVVFLDQNKLNFSKENLALISKREVLEMNRKHRFSENSEITKTNLGISKIDIKVAELKKELTSKMKD